MALRLRKARLPVCTIRYLVILTLNNPIVDLLHYGLKSKNGLSVVKLPSRTALDWMLFSARALHVTNAKTEQMVILKPKAQQLADKGRRKQLQQEEAAKKAKLEVVKAKAQHKERLTLQQLDETLKLQLAEACKEKICWEVAVKKLQLDLGGLQIKPEESEAMKEKALGEHLGMELWVAEMCLHKAEQL